MANSHTIIRKPAVSGFFYPRNPDTLAADIDRMIDSANAPKPAGRVRVLVSPHAGYTYSGHVAAHGYRLVRDQDIHTVVVISPSHVEHFGFCSVFDGDGYETPLGLARTNKELSDRVAAVNERVVKSDRGHLQTHLPRQEHSLEVQIPFLQRSLGSFGLVAVVMGNQTWDSCVALGNALSSVATDPGVLIVASTDLSHFHDAKLANRLDGEFREILTTMDTRALHDAIENNSCEACGAGPVIAALLAVDALKGLSCEVLDQKNSGDITGDFSSVVGYLSAAVIAPFGTRNGR